MRSSPASKREPRIICRSRSTLCCCEPASMAASSAGDAYMAAAGLPEARPDHAELIAEFAFGMLDGLERINGAKAVGLRIRIGIHTGPVVAGIIGRHKFIYDVWGDTVNVASRLESQG